MDLRVPCTLAFRLPGVHARARASGSGYDMGLEAQFLVCVCLRVLCRSVGPPTVIGRAMFGCIQPEEGAGAIFSRFSFWGVFVGFFGGVIIGILASFALVSACCRLHSQVPAAVPGLCACTRLRGAVSGCVATAGRGVRARRG